MVRLILFFFLLRTLTFKRDFHFMKTERIKNFSGFLLLYLIFLFVASLIYIFVCFISYILNKIKKTKRKTNTHPHHHHHHRDDGVTILNNTQTCTYIYINTQSTRHECFVCCSWNLLATTTTTTLNLSHSRSLTN